MEITLNGQKILLEGSMNVKQLIDHLDIGNQKIAVEIDLSIIPSSSYESKMIVGGEVVEIIEFVGGG